MQNTSRKTLIQLFHNHLEGIHSLPEYVRRIFMVISMIFASTFVGLFSWLMFSPLQSLNLPSLDTNQQTANYNQAVSNLAQVARNNELANVSKILEISPASGFIESFKAMKDMLVPKNIQNDPLEHIINVPTSWSHSWSNQLSGVSAGITVKLRELTKLIFERLQELQTYISNIVVSSLSYVISQISYAISYASYILSRISHVLSYITSVPSYISHILDLLISSLSRTAK